MLIDLMDLVDLIENCITVLTSFSLFPLHHCTAPTPLQYFFKKYRPCLLLTRQTLFPHPGVNDGEIF